MSGCIFCRIVAGEAPASFVHRDELVSAFMDSRPVTPGHVVVIPNEHAICTYDLPDATADRLFAVARRLARALRRSDAIRTDGTNFFVSDGEAIQTVFHAHLHVIPRLRDDGFVVGPRGDARSAATEEQLDAMASVVRQELSVTQPRSVPTIEASALARRGGSAQSMRSVVAWLAHRARKAGWRLFRPTTVGVRALVLDGDGRILLVRHSYTAGWYLPGGGVARGESVTDSLRRELLEEVGIEPTGSPRLLGVYSSTFEGKSDHIGVFVVDEWHQSPASNREVAAVEFFDPADLPPDTSAATRRRVAEHRGERALDYAW